MDPRGEPPGRDPTPDTPDGHGPSLRGYGIDGLLEAMARSADRHPDHCAACRDARLTTARELRELQDYAAGHRPDPPTPPPRRDVAPATPVWAVAVEVVETWRGARHPAVATIVRALAEALDYRGVDNRW